MSADGKTNAERDAAVAIAHIDEAVALDALSEHPGPPSSSQPHSPIVIHAPDPPPPLVVEAMPAPPPMPIVESSSSASIKDDASPSSPPPPIVDTSAAEEKAAPKKKSRPLSDSITEAFADFTIGTGEWVVELTAQGAPGPAGAKPGLQHLRLRPRRDGYTAIVVAGTVNESEKRAELRDHDHVAIMHMVRFRSALEIRTQDWEQFLRKAEVALNASGIQSMRTPPPRELLEQRRSMQRVSKGAVAAFVVVTLLAAIVLWRVAVALMS